MFYIQKTFEISAAHQLFLDYESKCNRLHGHNYTIVIFCKSATLDKNGMVLDFSQIKHKIQDRLDHQFLNEVMPGISTTAENIAQWICNELGDVCYRVSVQESEGNIAIYERG